jgi:mRNA interferase RelE/StbE
VKVAFRATFAKDLNGANKSLLKRVRRVIEAIEKADSLSEIANPKKPEGSNAYFRVRVGDYRIGMVLEGETIILCGV